MNLYLIGYRCTGKTSVSEKIGQALNWKSIDADIKLVEDHSMTVSEIVAKEGWPGFRKKEKSVLEEISKLTNHVIATGGGVILDSDNCRIMKETGIVIWLKATPETILERMIKDHMTDEQRPALTDKKLEQEIKDTLNERLPLYEDATHFSLETDHLSIEEIEKQILSTLKRTYAFKI